MVLPAPLGPITPRHSPGAMANDRPLTTVWPPKRLTRLGAEQRGRHGAIVRLQGGNRAGWGPPLQSRHRNLPGWPPGRLPSLPMSPFVVLQHLLPKRALTEAAGRLARAEGG